MYSNKNDSNINFKWHYYIRHINNKKKIKSIFYE